MCFFIFMCMTLFVPFINTGSLNCPSIFAADGTGRDAVSKSAPLVDNDVSEARFIRNVIRQQRAGCVALPNRCIHDGAYMQLVKQVVRILPISLRKRGGRWRSDEVPLGPVDLVGARRRSGYGE
ncbi:Aste57867_15732 [Aphanomyces stellatus]|uniref:Aste57867_15732 protein n=1 Tax=Aphanomyces stellatus TaxID=120398 RepID=A0A485L4D0_9STRA|nr:hypothetical protein As57867_015676 [Aphanomyces stellatus]VFT92521.1 Aste57867_15732 [Aphanomyces stellatus]